MRNEDLIDVPECGSGLNGVSLVYSNINDDDAELMDFAEKIAAREFNEHIRNKVQNEQSNIE